VAGDDHARAIDENGRSEAESFDAGGDLTNLAFGMGARVSRVRNQILNLLVANLQLI
jgi:hypothetical protein